jgi:uncharacterized damage-inducible protein DinB
MQNTFQSFIKLYQRDLERLSKEIEAIPEEQLWQRRPGITNSCGILAQHLLGNLNHFIGTQLGDSGFERNREREFSNTGLSKKELKQRIEKLKATIEMVLSNLDKKNGMQDLENFPYQDSINEGLMHLYGHLSYHLGQFNYLRRMIKEKDTA